MDKCPIQANLPFIYLLRTFAGGIEMNIGLDSVKQTIKTPEYVNKVILTL